MKELSFSDAEYGGKRTRREVFLPEMHLAVPWSQLGLCAPARCNTVLEGTIEDQETPVLSS